MYQAGQGVQLNFGKARELYEQVKKANVTKRLSWPQWPKTVSHEANI